MLLIEEWLADHSDHSEDSLSDGSPDDFKRFDLIFATLACQPLDHAYQTLCALINLIDCVNMLIAKHVRGIHRTQMPAHSVPDLSTPIICKDKGGFEMYRSVIEPND